MSLSPPSSNTLTVQVTPDDIGMRLDQWLAQTTGISRNKVQKALREGRVQYAEAVIDRAKHRVKNAEVYIIHIMDEPEGHFEPQEMPLDIVYEDGDLLVLNKPAGLVVHPGAGNLDHTLTNGLLAYCGEHCLSSIGSMQRPGIVHRLDKDTSGLLVVAKNNCTHLALQRQFQERTIQRRYHALVWGMVSPPTGHVECGIMRHPRHPQKMVTTTNPKGCYALTHYRLIRHFTENSATPCSLLECRLATGRTHQIRVHCHYLGHPLVGDPLYGRRRQAGKSMLHQHLVAFPRQALHAKTLGFVHPTQGSEMFFEAALPVDYAKLLKAISN
ncbi:MAG: RluA family pseudouridine synthase [Alphaproteobacteria bacterium]|nr:RluA family pseudouridine synthase [Alphaproteobacteria bacterium]